MWGIHKAKDFGQPARPGPSHTTRKVFQKGSSQKEFFNNQIREAVFLNFPINLNFFESTWTFSFQEKFKGIKVNSKDKILRVFAFGNV